MYIFNSFYLLHSCNLSFLICLCFNMVCFRGEKKAWATPRSVSFRSLIQKVRRASPPLSYEESPREYPLPARLIPGVFPFVNKQLSRVKKKIRGVLGSSLVWLFLVSDTMLSLKEWPRYSWSFYSNNRVREGKHCRFDFCSRGKQGAKTPDECMLFFRLDDKMWKWAAVKMKKTKAWVA